MRTKAVNDGDVWHIDGQKVWTTFGHHADWLYVLCRTDPDISLRHKGLSLLLVDVDQPGVDVRPIENLTRSTEFSECFFNNARADRDMVVGGVGNGWRVVMTTLGMERGSALMPMQLAMQREVSGLIDAAKKLRGRRRSMDPSTAGRRLYRRAISCASPPCGLSLTCSTTPLRRRAAQLPRRRRSASCSPPCTISKWVNWRWISTGRRRCTRPVTDPRREARKLFLLSRAETIYGGTSEIQRNIIAERVLGLPRI